MQASLERQLNLPISVVASANALIQAKGQIGFIDLFTLPLYETAAEAMPGQCLLPVVEIELISRSRLDRVDLRYFTDQCIANRALWQARYDTLQALAGDPQPIARTPLIEHDMVKDLSPEDRYRMLFPLSIPSSLLGDAVPTSENNESADASRPDSLYSNSLRQDTASTISSPMKEEVSSALDKLKSASSDVRTLRAAYRASIKRHPSNSFRHYRSTLGNPASTVHNKLET